MKNKAKILVSAVTLSLLLTSLSSTAADKFKVVTTFTVIADMARNVAGDAADIESITKPGAEIHEYQPTPGDIQRTQGAQLLLSNGLDLERWFEKFYQQLHDVPDVVVSQGVVPIGIVEGPYSGLPNPHAWMSPDNAIIYVNNIRDALMKYDPAHRQTYQQNAEVYKHKITAEIAPVKEKLAQIPDSQRWLVTSEGAFSYLARDFGLKELYLWPVNSDQEGTPQQIRKVVDTVKKYQIPAAFSESTVSDKPAREVARETGAHYGGVLYVDSLSEPTGPTPTYLDLLRVTADTVAEGMTAGVKHD